MANKYYRDGFGAVLGNYPARTKFNKSHVHKTAFNVGELVPIMGDELVPGDMINISVKALLRQMTLIRPVMDSLYVDIGIFGVPTMVIYPDFPKSLGANDDEGALKDKPLFPTIDSPAAGGKANSLADYMGFDSLKPVKNKSRLPFMAVAKVYNDGFRNQNLEKALHIDYTNAHKTGTDDTNPVVGVELGACLPIVNKYPDLFTTANPSPQKGEPVVLNLGDLAPVVALKDKNRTPGSDEGSITGEGATGSKKILGVDLGSSGKAKTGIADASTDIGVLDTNIIPTNLYSRLSEVTGIPINDLRMAISIQRVRELDALSGTRYPEIIEARYGVKSDDRNLQRSELIGGLHLPLNVQQVAQLNTGEKGFLGDLSAFSQTNGETRSFTKSVDEFGFLIVTACVRYKHTYSGLSKLGSHISDLDLYNPIFANIGEQPISNSEIFLSGKATDSEVFGFQEAGYEYKFLPNRVSGIMRPAEKNSLASWHYADDYSAGIPKLGSAGIKEDLKNVDRTLAIPSTAEGSKQLIVEFGFNYYADRPMPAYSKPGLSRI